MANRYEWAHVRAARPVPTEDLTDLTDAYKSGEVGMAFGLSIVYAPSWQELADGLEAAAALAREAEAEARPVTTEVGGVTIVEVPGHACYGVVREDPDWWHGPAVRRWVWDLANGHNGYRPTREAAIAAAARGIATTTPELDTWSSVSRQHYIDTGEYLPADRQETDQ